MTCFCAFSVLWSLFAIFALSNAGKSNNNNNNAQSSDNNNNGYGNDNCRQCLRNSDFRDGTFRITRSGLYCLCEDIVFNPRSNPQNPNKYGSYFPISEHSYPGSVNHANGGFALGFFAAISIETSNVELDLRGFEIKMSNEFYIQQRFYNNIEIQKAPFIFGEGPADFGQIQRIRNIYVHNGKLGLSSHNGLKGFSCDNVRVSDLKVYDFEVAGIQFNGFNGVTVENCDIGPSSTQVPFWGYYSHSRFVLNSFELIDDCHNKYVHFQGNRRVSLQQIRNDLVESMDIAFRYAMNANTDKDKASKFYKSSIDLYDNPSRLPDGSAIYGLIFNSRGQAVQGYGSTPNENMEDGSDLRIANVNIHDLRLSINEFPALYFDCGGYSSSDDGSVLKTLNARVLKSNFGDLFDIRKSLKYADWFKIDEGNSDLLSLSDMVYYGNVLSDAQVAVVLYSKTNEEQPGREEFLDWALAKRSNGRKCSSGLPRCSRFMCGTDCMNHLTKGVIGVRLDLIEYASMTDVHISNLNNESPLASNACGDYRGGDDGGNELGLDNEGYSGTDTIGISVIGGGVCDAFGDIKMTNLKSSYGDVTGIHIMEKDGENARVEFNNGCSVTVSDIKCAVNLNNEDLQKLKDKDQMPYPNNFYDCNILAENIDDRRRNAPIPYDQDHDEVITMANNGFLNLQTPPGMDQYQCQIFD